MVTLYTRKEAAEILRISKVTLDRIVGRGEIDSTLSGRHRVFRDYHIEKYSVTICCAEFSTWLLKSSQQNFNLMLSPVKITSGDSPHFWQRILSNFRLIGVKSILLIMINFLETYKRSKNRLPLQSGSKFFRDIKFLRRGNFFNKIYLVMKDSGKECVNILAQSKRNKCDSIANNFNAYSITANFYPIMNFIPFHFLEIGNIFRRLSVCNRLYGSFNSFPERSVGYLFDVLKKGRVFIDIHRCRKNSITSSMLSTGSFSISSIIRPKTISSYSSNNSSILATCMDNPLCLQKTFNAAITLFASSSVSTKSSSKSRRYTAESKFSIGLTNVFSRIAKSGMTRGNVLTTDSMFGKFFSDDAKINIFHVIKNMLLNIQIYLVMKDLKQENELRMFCIIPANHPAP